MAARKRILVTGGAGFIGSALVRVLLPANEVVVLDDFSVGRIENLEGAGREGNLTVVRGDIRDRATVEEAMRGVAVVYHLAVQCLRLSLSNPRLVHDVNTTGTLILCEAARREGVERFIYVSSSEVYGTTRSGPMNEEHPMEPTTPYAASKLAGEAYARAFHLTYGLPVVIVRPFNAYGPRSHIEGPYGEVIPRFVSRALQGLPPLLFGDGHQTRDFAYVTDTVEGIIRAGAREAPIGEVFNIASGTEMAIAELAMMVLDLTGRADLTPEHRPPRPGDVRRMWADISKANRLLGFEPQVSIREGIARYIEWVRARDSLPGRDALINWERNWDVA